VQGLVIRKLADRSDGHRVAVYSPEGVKTLVNPETGNAEAWPLLGVVIEGEAPAQCRVSTTFVNRGVAEGWISLENQNVTHEPGGPPQNPWAVTHTFIAADAIVLHTVGAETRYRVTHNPGKYVEGDGMRVDWFYDLELES
jgi:hypothetical protein